MGKPSSHGDGWRRDVYIAIGILVIAWTGCRLYLPAFRASGGRGMSYYDEFGPAVMAACGHGFVNPPPHGIPGLDAFLSESTATFDCASVGAQPPSVPFDAFQAVTKNLLLAAAAIWRVTGIAWAALDILVATMFAVALTAAYVAMRFVMGRTLAAVGTFVWAISPIHLGNVPHLRDYSKAPFFVLAAVAMGVALRAQRPRTLIAAGAAFGIVQAIGFGMRTDVILNFAPFLLVLFVLGGGEWQRNIPWKIAAAAVSLTLFVVFSWSVLVVYRRSEGLWHVVLLGLTTPFDDPLSLRRSLYNFGYLYDDSYISTVVQAYWARAHGEFHGSLHGAGLYETASREYYKLLASTFPADFLTRMAGSTLRVLNLPFMIGYGIVPPGFSNVVMRSIEQARAPLMLLLAGVGPLVAALLVILIGIRDRVAAFVGVLILLFWSAYPYLQFQGRHVFHLEILSIVMVLWTATLLSRTIAVAAANRSWRADGIRALQSAAMVASLLVAGAGVLGVVRLAQRPSVHALFQRYEDAAEESVDGGLFEPRGQGERIQQAMLVVNVTAACGPEVPMQVRYERSGGSELDFSRTVTVAVRGGSSRVFIPVFSIEAATGQMSRFERVQVPPAAAPCVRVARARDAERSPLMLDATLPQDWSSQPLYQRLYIGPILPERLWLRIARWWPRVAELG